MTHEALKRMYQLLLTEPHAPTVCAQLESIAREALADHAMRNVQRLGQEIEQEKALQALHDENKRLGLYEDAYAQPEPVAWPCEIEEADFEQDTITLKMLTSEYVIRAGKHWLSTTPPQRKPLTEEQIVAKALHLSGIGTSPDVLQFARAIEAAHGIKENT